MCLAIPARVIQLPDEDTALVELGGVEKAVSTALLDEVQVGDYVVVHVGYALNRIDPEEAAKTLELFRQMGQLADPA